MKFLQPTVGLAVNLGGLALLAYRSGLLVR
jgi:hypothetical protein